MSSESSSRGGDDDEFVQNVSGDEFDEFEKKLEQSYQQRMEMSGGNQSRPESSNNNRLMSGKSRPSDLRPLTGSQFQIGASNEVIEEEKNDNNDNSNSQNQNQITNNALNNENSIYHRFSKFIIENKIERDDFCRPIHIFITQEELEVNFNQVSFDASKDEIFSIFKDHNAHKTGYLPMEDFYKKLKCWREYKDRREEQMNALRDQANNLVDRNRLEEIGARANGQYVGTGSKKRPTTAVVAGAKNLRAMQNNQKSNLNRVESANKMSSQLRSNANQSGQETKVYAEDKTKHYLKLAKQKKEEEERALALTIDKGKRETEFDCLHKMGEACEIAKMLNVPVSFSAFKGPDGSLKIHFFQFIEDQTRQLAEDDDDHHEPHEVAMREIKREITMKEFYREYRKLKRMQNSVKNNYTQASHGGAGGQPGKPPNISQNTIVSSYSLNRINKKERQEELKQVLQETMKLTKKLKEQLKILERNGVCGTQTHKGSNANMMGKSQSPSVI
eukprot:403345066